MQLESRFDSGTEEFTCCYKSYNTSEPEDWRSLVAHLPYTQLDTGSNPVSSTYGQNKRTFIVG